MSRYPSPPPSLPNVCSTVPHVTGEAVVSGGSGGCVVFCVRSGVPGGADESQGQHDEGSYLLSRYAIFSAELAVEILSVSLSPESKGRRFSRRLAEKKRLAMSENTPSGSPLSLSATPLRHSKRRRTSTTHLPPPPPPPPPLPHLTNTAATTVSSLLVCAYTDTPYTIACAFPSPSLLRESR